MKAVARDDAVAMLRGADHMLDRLPDDCTWFRTTWRAVEPAALRHVYAEAWAALSGGSGRIEASARAVREGAPGEVAGRVRDLAAAFDPARCDPLFLGANDPATGPFVVMDGNHRITAIELRRLSDEPVAAPDVAVVVAVSTRPIWNWEA